MIHILSFLIFYGKDFPLCFPSYLLILISICYHLQEARG